MASILCQSCSANACSLLTAEACSISKALIQAHVHTRQLKGLRNGQRAHELPESSQSQSVMTHPPKGDLSILWQQAVT